MDKWLSYDKISLIPTKVSTISSRADVDTSVQFGPLKLSVPLIAAPMPDVSNGAMAKRLRELGSFGWIHRFQSEDQMQKELLSTGTNDQVGIALPGKVKEAELMASRFYHGFGVRIFCIDTANGASVSVQETLGRLKQLYPDIFIVAGNIASAENFFELEKWGADAIRVGIAGGSVCETRTETGVYSPMATAIWECAQQGHQNLVAPKEKPLKPALLIADGGIKTPADVSKALALGADLVMAGSIFAGTKESPGEPIKLDGKLVKLFRGAASYSVQEGKSEHVEGKESLVDYKGSVERVINRFAAGLRSSMSYNDARDLNAFRKNVKIVEI